MPLLTQHHPPALPGSSGRRRRTGLTGFLSKLFANEKPPSSSNQGGRGSQDVGMVDPAKSAMQDPDSGERVKEEKSSLPVSVAISPFVPVSACLVSLVSNKRLWFLPSLFSKQ